MFDFLTQRVIFILEALGMSNLAARVTTLESGGVGGGSPAAWGSITGSIASQTDLQSALDAKANTSHTQAWGTLTGSISSQTDLNTALSGKAASSHTHGTADLTNLSSYTGLDARYYTETETDTLLAAKQATLVSGTNIKTINGSTILGSGNMVISGTGSPGGSSAQMQYNNAGAFAGASGAEIEGGQIRLPAISTPTAPASGGVKLFGTSLAGRVMPTALGPGSKPYVLQPHSGYARVAAWQPTGNSTSIVAVGASPLTATGAVTTANVATTSAFVLQRRVEFLQTVAATTNVAGFRAPSLQWSVGSTVDEHLGGFHMVCRWGVSTGATISTHRAFVGMCGDTGAPTDVQPSTVQNIVGMGWDSTDTNIQIMHRNDGTVTKIDLGASFPKPSVGRTSCYELSLYSPPGSTQSVTYRVTNLVTGATATGTITTNLPLDSNLLAPRGWISVGGTNSVIGLALMNLYVESDL